MLFLFLFCLTQQPSSVLKLDLDNLQLARVHNFTVNESGIFLNDGAGFKGFDHTGKLIMSLASAENEFNFIRTFYVGKDLIWITDPDSPSSYFYNFQGEFLFKDDALSAINIHPLKPGYFAVTPLHTSNKDRKTHPFLHYINLNREPYPRLINVCKIDLSPKGVLEKTRVQSFYKAPKTLSEKRLQFKKLWVLPEGSGYVVINEIDNLSYLYNQSHLNQEKKVAVGKPYTPRTASLNLPGFKQVKGTFQGKPFYRDNKEYLKEVICWMLSYSRIGNVLPTNSGYLVGYSVPKKSCEWGHFVLAKLNKNFRFQTTVLELDQHAYLAGFYDNKAYVLVTDFKVENGAVVSANPEMQVFNLIH